MSYLYDAQNLLDVMSEYPEFCSSDPRTETCRIRSAEESGTSSPCDSSHSYPIILTSEHSRSSANKMTHFIKISKFYKHKFDRNESFNLHMIMIYVYIIIIYFTQTVTCHSRGKHLAFLDKLDLLSISRHTKCDN